MTKEQLQRIRTEFIELCEALHSMRGDPSMTWQKESPEYAATLAEIEAELAAEPPLATHDGVPELTEEEMATVQAVATQTLKDQQWLYKNEPPAPRTGDLTAAEAAEVFNRIGRSGLSFADVLARLSVNRS